MEEDLGFKPPFTLGHENAGWVAALGSGVAGFKEGDAAAAGSAWMAGWPSTCSCRPSGSWCRWAT